MEQLRPEEFRIYKQLVLEALKTFPQNFSFAYSELVYKPDSFWVDLLPQAFVLRAADSPELVGAATLTQDMGYSKHCGDVRFVYVRPVHGGQGHGSAIMNYMHTQAALRGIEKLFLSVVHTNPAFSWYKRLGYIVHGYEQDIRRIHGRSYDRYLMYKEISIDK